MKISFYINLLGQTDRVIQDKTFVLKTDVPVKNHSNVRNSIYCLSLESWSNTAIKTNDQNKIHFSVSVSLNELVQSIAMILFNPQYSSL